MIIEAPPCMGLQVVNTAYPHAGIPYVQMMPQQNLLLRPPHAAMFTNTSHTAGNNMIGQLAQAPIPPPIGAVPLPPPLPRGQQLSLPGITTSNNATAGPRAHTLLKNSADVAGVLGNTGSINTGRIKDTTSSPPKRAAAGKMVSKPPRSNEKQGALLVPPLANLGNAASDGKVKCECGGKFLHDATSWRHHIITKRHQRWMESQVQLGQHGNNLI
jgi:hypothetical protein